MSKLRKSITLETTFDNYLAQEIIGEGGSGRVYGGKNSAQEDVAIKFCIRYLNQRIEEKGSKMKFTF